MYRALIVEDDACAADVLRSHLARFAAEKGTGFSIEILGSALELLEGNHPADVIFRDIGLPGINGMEAAEIIRQKDQVTPLVFVTDLAQYAVRGYQVDAVDFMVKPIAYEDFSLRMGRVIRVMARNDSEAVSLSTASGLRMVPAKGIVFVEILKHDLYWHIAGEAEPLRMRGSIKETAELLGEERFCRISASHIANMGQVKRVRANELTMSDGSELSISRSRKAQVLEALARYAGASQ